MEKVRRSAATYFIVQATAVVGWWLVLIVRPELRVHFQLEAGSQTSLMAFWMPDAVFIALGSAVAGILVLRKSKLETAALWLVTGAVSYAAIYTLSFAMISDDGWLGVVLMLPAMVWSGVFATALTVKGDMFRQAKETSTNYVLLKTLTQIVIVWGLILFVLPYLITIAEDKIGIPQLESGVQRLIAIMLFVALSSIGIYSAIVMSRIGKGTPLPLDHASDLVVRGPYAYVRNPMAVSGIGQGLAVALFLGSPMVALYAVMGSAIWQFVFRPLEEDDLAARFGDAYMYYCREVKCWVPNGSAFRKKIHSPHQIEGTADSSNSIDRPSGRI